MAGLNVQLFQNINEAFPGKSRDDIVTVLNTVIDNLWEEIVDRAGKGNELGLVNGNLRNEEELRPDTPFYLRPMRGSRENPDEGCQKHVFLVKRRVGGGVSLVASFRRCNGQMEVKGEDSVWIKFGGDDEVDMSQGSSDAAEMNGGRRRKSRRRKSKRSSTKSKKNVRRRTARY